MAQVEKTETKRKTRIGRVVSNKMDKTAIIRIDRVTRHSVYSKAMRRCRNFKVHDEKNAAKIGDTVKVASTRPLSKDKRWKMVEVVKSAEFYE